MRNNFTFRSRTETYFTHLSAQPLMILFRRLFVSLIRRSRIKERKSRSSFVVCMCAYIFLYTDVFLWRHLESSKSSAKSSSKSCSKNFAETLRFSGSVLFFIDCGNLIDLLIFLIGNTKMLITSPKINIFWCGFFLFVHNFFRPIK